MKKELVDEALEWDKESPDEYHIGILYYFLKIFETLNNSQLQLEMFSKIYNQDIHVLTTKLSKMRIQVLNAILKRIRKNPKKLLPLFNNLIIYDSKLEAKSFSKFMKF